MAIATTPRTTEQPTTAEPMPVAPPIPWRWMVAACLLLLGSGAVRVAQEYRFGVASQNASKAPFSLRDIPTTLGDDSTGKWVNEGGEKILDKETRQIANAVDYMDRVYVDERTGVRLEALVVFGSAEGVFPHSPTVCFPSFGYNVADGSRQHLIPTTSGTAVFASWIYVKPALPGSRTEVFYSFWHDGLWSPYAAQTSKRFRHHPEMFKVQVQRIVGPTERRTMDDANDELPPIEDFLQKLLPELEQRIMAAGLGPMASDASTAKAEQSDSAKPST
jgi:Protein of unknown function (DUF3485)